MTKFGTAERMKELFLTFGDNMFLLKVNSINYYFLICIFSLAKLFTLPSCT